jgi:hypothetical protein
MNSCIYISNRALLLRFRVGDQEPAIFTKLYCTSRVFDATSHDLSPSSVKYR